MDGKARRLSCVPSHDIRTRDLQPTESLHGDVRPFSTYRHFLESYLVSVFLSIPTTAHV
jgi:hypothetical protein